MIIQAVPCPHCQSRHLIRHGTTDDGRQRYQCPDCGRRSREAPRPNGYSDDEQALILRAYQERSSLRGLTRTFGVARNTVVKWVKKSPCAPALSATLVPPAEGAALELELDEMGSFVGAQRLPAWVWLAVCRRTRQVVAWELGDRSENACQALWDAVPQAFRQAVCYTDFWDAYQAVLPDAQHEPAGKEAGQTAHVERFNNTVRQRLGRFVRRTLSFSKCDLMHDACLSLFLHAYNLSRADTLA